MVSGVILMVSGVILCYLLLFVSFNVFWCYFVLSGVNLCQLLFNKLLLLVLEIFVSGIVIAVVIAIVIFILVAIVIG